MPLSSRPGSPPPLLVTASVDEIQLHRPISIDRDATVTGKVVWTGSSSLDIQMQLWQDESAGQSAAAAGQIKQLQPSLVAMFSFVHLDPVSKRPSPVVQLQPVTPHDKAAAAVRQALADARRSARQAQSEGTQVLGE